MNKTEINGKLGEIVEYQGIKYKFTGCIYRKNSQGEFFYQAELTDMGGNSLVICRLEDVE